jgi:signal transduction histidine kinase
MRRIRTLWILIINSGADSLSAKLSFYLILNVAILWYSFISGPSAYTEAMAGFLIGVTYFLFESFLFRVICIGTTILIFLSPAFNLRSGISRSAAGAAGTGFSGMDPTRWSAYAIMLFLLAAVIYYSIKKNKYSRKVETELEKEVISGQNKTTFIRNAYHEVKGQFWGVFVLIKILMKAYQTGQIQNMNKMLGDLTNGCQNLQLLLTNILEYSKFESGIWERPFFEPVNLRSKIGGLIDLCQYAADEKNLQIDCCFSDEIPDYVACDDMKLTQVVINLLNNAIKFSKPGTTIAVLLHKDIDRWRISIKDHGKGIRPDKLPYIFDAFVTGKDRHSNAEGVGLGLHITKQLVAALQGEIQVSSEENAGSCFTVHLPMIPFETSHQQKILCKKEY